MGLLNNALYGHYALSRFHALRFYLSVLYMHFIYIYIPSCLQMLGNCFHIKTNQFLWIFCNGFLVHLKR